MATNGNAIGTPFLKSNAIPPAIRNSMILWYDLKKQGATNETMSTNPILKDLSGNGHDATCYNFAWSGMSGIGGYECRDFDGFSFRKSDGSSETEGDYARKISNFEINIFRKVYNVYGIGYWPLDSNKFRCKILVSGIKETQQLFVSQYNGLYDSHELYNGENDITIDFTESEKPNYNYATFYTDNVSNDEYNITVKLLPLYPNALVSDGVDDYCLVEGLPLLNKEDGYTVIAKRKWIEIPTQTTALSSKRDIDNSIDGAFQFEYTTQNRQIEMNFGTDTSISFIQENISWATSQQYNNMSIRIGRSEDSDIMQLFRSTPRGVYAKIALHSFILFNRDLTTEEIEWVKTNLIEK